MLNVEKIREDFKVLNNNSKLVYFDTACMSLKPNQVISSVVDYYEKYPVCAGRSSHKMSLEVNKKVAETRKEIAKFINAKSENEIIFTRNATEGINLLVNSFPFKKGDVILLTDKEHNSNLIPWLYLRDKIGIEVKILRSLPDNTFDLEKFKIEVKGVKFVSIVHTSNLDGVTNPAKEIIKIAHENNALVMLDSAQSVLHRKIDVKDLDVDFLVFSGHKMLGPTGIGIFYGKYELLEKLNSFIVGGDTVEFSDYDNYKMFPVPAKFEAGLQDYAGIIGTGEAVKYLSQFNFQDIQEHELMLNSYITEELSKFKNIKIIGPLDSSLRSSIITFYIEGKNMQQLGVMLDEMEGIATRTGQLCLHSYFRDRKIINATRISLSFYNTIGDAEKFINSLSKILKIIS